MKNHKSEPAERERRQDCKGAPRAGAALPLPSSHCSSAWQYHHLAHRVSRGCLCQSTGDKHRCDFISFREKKTNIKCSFHMPVDSLARSQGVHTPLWNLLGSKTKCRFLSPVWGVLLKLAWACHLEFISGFLFPFSSWLEHLHFPFYSKHRVNP